ncbi:hypothetical protein E2C01_064086 [Portunus trituberculatus]|uniref:Uncharacterized protein n=1 Tax=Portunus trituberculatus TaxID=210409 RepID=A0A5B7HJX7_PORTR|nr:hypothetical protein [Portunus trituberculatus]
MRLQRVLTGGCEECEERVVLVKPGQCSPQRLLNTVSMLRRTGVMVASQGKECQWSSWAMPVRLWTQSFRATPSSTEALRGDLKL